MAIIEIREFFLFRFDYDVSGLFVDLDGRYFMYLGGVGLMGSGRSRAYGIGAEEKDSRI